MMSSLPQEDRYLHLVLMSICWLVDIEMSVREVKNVAAGVDLNGCCSNDIGRNSMDTYHLGPPEGSIKYFERDVVLG